MTTASEIDKAPSLFYGWLLVAVVLLALSIGSGTTIYMYSVVAGSVGEAFAAGRFVLMTGSTGMLLAVCVLSPALGALLDRYPIRWVLMAGSLSMGAGFILVGLSTHVWQVIVCYVLFIGIGLATLSPLTASTLLARWFVRHRGLALGIAALGTQFGGLIYPPIIAGLIETVDWRFALIVLGFTILVVMPVLSYVAVVDHPRHKGLQPDGDAAPRSGMDTERVSEAVPTLFVRQLLRQRNFLLLVAILGAAAASNTALLANLSLFATDIGEPVVRGAFLVSLVAILGMVVSPLVGWLCDIISIRLVAVLVIGCLAAAFAVFSAAGDYPLLVLAASFQGVAGGGIVPLWASLVGRLYDMRFYGRVMGVTTMVVFGLSALAPLFAGWIHDLTGSYRLLFLCFLALLAFMTVAIAWLRVPVRDAEKFGAELPASQAARQRASARSSATG